MTHELEMSNGTARMAYADREIPWHRLGTPMRGLQTAEAMLDAAAIARETMLDAVSMFSDDLMEAILEEKVSEENGEVTIDTMESIDKKLEPIEGLPPKLMSEPTGCSFAPRCQFVMDRCRAEVPPLEPDADGRLRACFVSIRQGEA
ncbi:MAG TPA: hypothetical protein EYQ31_14115, partial [Candidatus Handelsmanbacteria bacterium]|nr:hypothetical protein [Candidatus Handelsmanbacteria bacterium]